MFCRKKFHTSAWGNYPPPPLSGTKAVDTFFFFFFLFFSQKLALINEIKRYEEHNYKIVIYASNNWSRPTPLVTSFFIHLIEIFLIVGQSSVVQFLVCI